MKPRKASIATMVIAIIVITVSIVLGIVGSIAYRYYSKQKWADFHDALKLEANQFAVGLAPAAWNLEYPQVSKLMESQMQDPRYAGIIVDLETKRFIIARDRQGAVQNRETEFPTDGLIPAERNIIFSDQQVGLIRIYTTPRYIEDELHNAFALLATLVVLLDLILTLALYFSLQRLVLKPLRTVERYADEVAHGGAAATALDNPSFVGELEALTQSIDAMVRQLAMRNDDLQKSTERFQSVIRLLPIPLCLYDEAGTTVFLNDRFSSTFGYTLADIPHADHWFAKAYPDAGYRQDVLANWEREVEEARRLDHPIRALTYDVRCLDGSIKHVEIGGILTADVNIAVLNDVTDRTVAERELARYREHLEELVTMRTMELAKTYQRLEETQFAMDHAGIGIVWIDAHDGRFLYVNDQAGELCGRSASELQGMHVIQVATEFTPERLRELAGDLLHRGFARIETTISCADGSQLPIETSLYFKPPSEERPGHYIAFLTDINQRKATEAALIQAKMAAESAAQARSEFLANMSHEIRTPMNAIIGMSQLALQTDLDKRQRNYIEKVNLSAGSLLGILNDILDFSKVEAGRLDIEHLEFPLERVFDNLANLLAIKAEEKGLELIFDISPETPMHLIGDPMRLGQILINLAGNAVKFTNQGTVVVGCAAERKGSQVQLKFSVRDSGIGMSEAQMGALFAPFQQGDNSISRRYGGTGLGLAICKRLAELMGGNISVDSRLGHGSTFTFTAPFDIPEGADENSVRLPDTLHGERVLVVDDNPESLEVLCNLVERFGMAVDRANSAQEALPLMHGPFRYRLLICDWKMPGMDGIEMIRTMTVTPGAQIPSIIIMVSAYGVEELRHATAHLPLTGILTKPVSPSSVLDILLSATGQPAATRQGGETPRAFKNAGTLADAHILLVEDNAINQELAHELLCSEGAEVTLANNGQEALDKLQDSHFDCVLMDVQMPVMDGLAATRAIRAQERFRDLPIIAMTAGALPSEREQTLLAGMNDHITKPIDIEVLFAVIRRSMKRPLPAIALAASTPPPGDQPGKPPVLDVARGMAALNGNQATYRRILQTFLETGSSALDNLRQAAATEDISAIAALAHTLKGTAGTMGAMAVQALAQRLDETARHQPEAGTLPAMIEEFTQIWPLTVEAAQHYLATTADDPWAGSTGQARHANLLGILEQLRSQLLADDTDALETLDGISAESIPPALSGEFINLTRHITKYQFEAALLNLEHILNRCAPAAATENEVARPPDGNIQP